MLLHEKPPTAHFSNTGITESIKIHRHDALTRDMCYMLEGLNIDVSGGPSSVRTVIQTVTGIGTWHSTTSASR